MNLGKGSDSNINWVDPDVVGSIPTVGLLYKAGGKER